jgi:uncharacterized protein YfaS (alpha-2-macroglobulin family)
MKAIVAALLTVGVLACSKGDGVGGGGSSAAQGPVVGSYRIGRSLAPDGSATNETDMYTPGETVHMSFVVKNAPSDVKVRLVFSTLPDNRKVAELERSTAKNGSVSFELKDTKNWALGTYRAQYFLLEGGRETSLGIHDFKLVASRTAPTP